MRQARVHGLLTRAPDGTRSLDQLVALELGWEMQSIIGVRHWRRPAFRFGWTRGSDTVPPRYTTNLMVLLSEVPGIWTVTLTLAPGHYQAQLGDDTPARAQTIELALAASIVASELCAVMS